MNSTMGALPTFIRNVKSLALVYHVYQLPPILTALLALPDKHCLSHGMCLYQVMMTLHFLNDVANDAESTQKSKITSNR